MMLPDRSVPSDHPIRIALADDAVLLREALAASLAASGFDVVGGVGNASALEALVAAEDPDVVIVDVRMPPSHSTEGLEAAQRLRRARPSLGILVLSQYVETRYAMDLVREDPRGVGYLLKDRVTRVVDLADAVRRIAAGGAVIDPEIVARLMGRPRTRSLLDDLTRRERDILALMAEGRSNAGIATALSLGVKTVEGYVGQIFSKLDLEADASDHRRVQAVLVWLREDGRHG